MKPQDDPWFRRRRYIHFDLPTNAKQARAITSSPLEVERHAFYPCIYSVVATLKVSRDPTTKKVERKLKERDIAYAAHMDSHIYSYYAWQLSQLYEKKVAALQLGNSVLAFRALGKSNIDFAGDAFAEILKRGGCDVVAFDIKGFFDNLDHLLLKRAWAAIIGADRLPADHYNVFRSLTRWCRVRKQDLYRQLGISIHNPNGGNVRRRRICTPEEFRRCVRGSVVLERNSTDRGIPQGSPMSAVLSNIYMLNFDERMDEFARSIGARYMRYCDDMIVIGPTGQGASIKAFVQSCITDVKLEIQAEKTEDRVFSANDLGVVSTDKPLQYLGFIFDGKDTRIRSSSMMRYFDRMRRGVSVTKKAAKKRNRRRRLRGDSIRPVHLKTIYRRYSYIGRRNFLSYGQRAAAAMDAKAIRAQLKPLWGKLAAALQQ